MFSKFNVEHIIRSRKLRLVVTALLAAFSLAGSVRADVVTDWNQTAIATLSAGGVRFPPQTRALAMMHAAIFDAVNATNHRYTAYAVNIYAPHASPEAAAAAAAHGVLVNLIPSQQVNLDAAYADSLAQVSDGAAKDSGIALGLTVASGILALRSADGSNAIVPYTPGSGPGVWQPTPPNFGPAVFVAFATTMPFTLRSSSQFLAEGPPSLSSDEYTRDFNEVKSLGAVNSATRNADQTEAALFWIENSDFTWNLIARSAAAAHQNDLSENARLFALLNMATADGIIAGFNTKYTYNFWRPITAIRSADTDGNNETVADPAWTPLSPTPAHPDYTSNHSIYSAAAAKVLALVLGSDDFDFSITSSTAPNGAVRSYHSFSQAAEECGMSRIWLGFHFQTAVRHGLNQGKQIGPFAFEHCLTPV
ncbi:MAG: hypothetical protein AUI36_47415, partial [Cyanobacteria bacterium 13_1_40CM_2_61_4]